MPNPAQFRDRIDVKPESLVSPLRTKNGEWYSGSNLDKEFAHDHLVPWLSTEDFQAARALAGKQFAY
ncbi:hypothetical protein FRC03_007278 [Tulasnella sp. 419]|nr:hypothetical protein FRC03_007278 [Tulasnella sp. 419]